MIEVVVLNWDGKRKKRSMEEKGVHGWWFFFLHFNSSTIFSAFQCKEEKTMEIWVS